MLSSLELRILTGMSLSGVWFACLLLSSYWLCSTRAAKALSKHVSSALSLPTQQRLRRLDIILQDVHVDPGRYINVVRSES